MLGKEIAQNNSGGFAIDALFDVGAFEAFVA
jgi:hypothetical protein